MYNIYYTISNGVLIKQLDTNASSRKYNSTIGARYCCSLQLMFQLIPPDTAGSLVVIRSRGLSGGSLGGDLKIRDTLMMSKKTQARQSLSE